MLDETRKRVHVQAATHCSVFLSKKQESMTWLEKRFVFISIFQISPEPNSSQTFDHYPFLAYSPNGTVEADLVYANYGDDADFEKLAEMNVTVKGNIVIIRSRRVSMNELQVGCSSVLVVVERSCLD